MDWKSIRSQVETFLNEEEAETITIIKTGFENSYLVVHDDSLHFRTGECTEMKKEEIETKYGIKIHTCIDCPKKQSCEFAFDDYNTNEDCLADK